MCRYAPEWLHGESETETVISNRIRLARNLKSHFFVHRNSREGHIKVLEKIKEAVKENKYFKNGLFLDMAKVKDLDKKFLMERHLISPNFAEAGIRRGLFISDKEMLSLMINEEDHIRLQALEPGFDLLNTWRVISRVDDELNNNLDYAVSKRFGYLTACPTNTGTGLRASILIHLPALVLTREIDKVIRGITQVGLTVRGLYGEGTDVSGNLFQISNQTTLGQSEEEIIESIEKIVRQIIEYEKEARETLLKDARIQIEDKIWRAYGLLKNARLLSSHEFMNLSSAVRLGIDLGLIKDVTSRLLNELLILTRPAHIQKQEKRDMDTSERDMIRANFVRKKLNSFLNNKE